MRKALLIPLFGFLFFQAAAQRSFSIGLQANSGGKAFEGKGGYGAALTFLAPAGHNGAFRLYAGYDRFPDAIRLIGSPDGSQAVSFIPLLAGYQQYLYSDNVFVFGAAGVTATLHPSDNQPGFAYSFGTGYKMNLKQSKLLQFSISYHSTAYHDSHFSWGSFGIAYGFKSGKRKSYKRDE